MCARSGDLAHTATRPPYQYIPKPFLLEHASDLGHLHPLPHAQAVVVRLHGLQEDSLIPPEIDIDLGFGGVGDCSIALR